MEFSKANWEDCQATLPSGKTRLLKRSSVFPKRVMQLKDLQWADIKQAALQMQEKPRTALPSMDLEDLPEESDDDSDELHDPCYDNQDSGEDMDEDMDVPSVGGVVAGAGQEAE
ncbi:hypothetical protein H0H81_011873 [Sphagnurus paluster]|uniref:Uncharacterized protein n=1 Tax=Sphagnurus paluster TaxID=117069 RepID=A0A9P7K6T7_9AGAR|nr:hypothetical protein H0H81_011873 [Sphagnurus paluster]